MGPLGGSLGILEGILGGPWGGPGVIRGSLGGPWGSRRGSRGVSGELFWSYWGNVKSLKNLRFLLLFRNMGSQGEHQRELWDPRGVMGCASGPPGVARGNPGSPRRATRGAQGAPWDSQGALREGIWAPRGCLGRQSVTPEVLIWAKLPRTWPPRAYRHDLSSLFLRILEDASTRPDPQGVGGLYYIILYYYNINNII